MATLRDQIADLDRAIRSGGGRTVRAALKEIEKKKIPRSERAALARLSWRCDLPLLGIRLLNPIVRPSAKRPFTATDEEQAEYAACLTMAGARDEASRILAAVSEKKYPQALLYRSFALVANWDYAGAIPVLRKYLASPRLTPYQSLIGRINLAAALVWGRDYASAQALLKRLIKETRNSKADFALGYCLELDAIPLVDSDRFTEAEKALKEAESFLEKTGSNWNFFVRKWRAVMALKQNPKSAEALAQLHAIGQEAFANGDWETARVCDFYEAKSLGQEEKARLVYFGTPFETFRQRLLTDWGKPLPMPESFPWPVGTTGKGPEVDLLTDLENESLKPGSLLYRLLFALASDFYRPFPVAALYAQLYPDEFFNPASSPARVHEAVKRLRQWLKAEGLPLKIEEREGEYRLSSAKPVRLLVPAEKLIPSLQSPLVDRLRKAWPQEGFSITEACECLGLQRRTTQRLLEDLTKEGTLQRTGKSRATKYHFSS